MKKYIKVYSWTILISVACVALPLLLSLFGVITNSDVLNRSVLLAIIFAMIASFCYALYAAPEWRVILPVLILNPFTFCAIFVLFCS